jgi:hypothetical protein
MNPGYLSYILYSVTVILLCTGWFAANINGKDRKWIWLFVISWPLCSWASITYFESTVIQGAFFLLLIGMIRFWLKIQSDQKISALTMGFLLGSVVYLLKEIMRMDPVLIILDEDLNISLLLILLVLLAFSKLSAQVFSITFGLLMGEYLFVITNSQWIANPVLLGDKPFQDLWWMTVAILIVSSKVWNLSRARISSYILSKRGVRSE